MTINYFHKKGLIYRDLKPNNVIVDDHKNAFIIDFDRMITKSEADSDSDHTNNFQSVYAAPEINEKIITDKCDIYSIGQMIYFIINENPPSNEINENIKIESFSNDSKLLSIYMRCTDLSPENRPSISDLLFQFYLFFSSYISNTNIIFDSDVLKIHNIIQSDSKYLTEDIKKTISKISKIKDPSAYDVLGYLYFYGNYIDKDVEKGIGYLLKAADQNYSKAQCNLGAIYYEGKNIKRDINKAINYFLLAEKQNNSSAQGILGVIYFEGRYIKQDIEKAIHFFSLSAQQNDSQSQYNLGLIYYNGEYVKQDFNKALNYFKHSAKLNNAQSLHTLGVIYYNGKYVKQNIEKAISYFKQAAKLNNSKAYFCLGDIYYDGEYVDQDINKAIHYYTISANLNNANAQFTLGKIYFGRKYIKSDIEKAIHFFTQAADQNYIQAQNILGSIYLEGKQYILDDFDLLPNITL